MSLNHSLPTLLQVLNIANPPSWVQRWISGELMFLFFLEDNILDTLHLVDHFLDLSQCSQRGNGVPV